MSTLAPVGYSKTVGGPAKNIDDASLVYHVNLLLCAVLAIFIAIKLPRAFALFGTQSEWFNGHILRYVPYKPSRRLVQAVHSAYPPPIDSGGSDYKDTPSSDDNHTLYSANVHHVQRLTEQGSPVIMQYPLHVPACIKPLRPLLTPLRARISPGFSVAQLLIILAWFYALVYAAFYKTNIFSGNARAGWIAVAQLPLIFSFAQKNNVLGSFLGYGYEKVCDQPLSQMLRRCSDCIPAIRSPYRSPSSRLGCLAKSQKPAEHLK